MHAEVGLVTTICKLDGSLPVDERGIGVAICSNKLSRNHEEFAVLGRSVIGVLRLLRLGRGRLDLAHHRSEALASLHKPPELPETYTCIRENENPGSLGKGPLL